MFSNPELPFWGTLCGVKPRTERTQARIATFGVELSHGHPLPPVAVEMRDSRFRWTLSEAVSVTLKTDRHLLPEGKTPVKASKLQPGRMRPR